MKWQRKNRPGWVKTLACAGSIALFGALAHAMTAGFSYAAAAVAMGAAAGLAAPAIASGDGIPDVIIGFLEMVLEGVLVVVETIGQALSGLTG